MPLVPSSQLYLLPWSRNIHPGISPLQYMPLIPSSQLYVLPWSKNIHSWIFPLQYIPVTNYTSTLTREHTCWDFSASVHALDPQFPTIPSILVKDHTPCDFPTSVHALFTSSCGVFCLISPDLLQRVSTRSCSQCNKEQLQCTCANYI